MVKEDLEQVPQNWCSEFQLLQKKKEITECFMNEFSITDYLLYYNYQTIINIPLSFLAKFKGN